MDAYISHLSHSEASQVSGSLVSIFPHAQTSVFPEARFLKKKSGTSSQVVSAERGFVLQEQGSKIRRFAEIFQLPSMVVFWACVSVRVPPLSPRQHTPTTVELK